MKTISVVLLAGTLACLGCCITENYNPAGSRTHIWVPGVGKWLIDEQPVPPALINRDEENQSEPTSRHQVSDSPASDDAERKLSLSPHDSDLPSGRQFHAN